MVTQTCDLGLGRSQAMLQLVQFGGEIGDMGECVHRIFDALIELNLHVVDLALDILDEVTHRCDELFLLRLRLTPQSLDLMLGLLAEVADRLGESLNEFSGSLNDHAQRLNGEHAPVAFLFLENNLGQRDGGQVFTRAVIDDAHFLTQPNHDCDLVESYVATALGVVELSIAVALDELHGDPVPAAADRGSRQIMCSERKEQLDIRPVPFGV